jgi:hypothetical protein
MSKRKVSLAEKKYFSSEDVRALLGLENTKQAIRWLRREGAAVKKGSRIYTTRNRLMAAFPEVFQSLAR